MSQRSTRILFGIAIVGAVLAAALFWWPEDSAAAPPANRSSSPDAPPAVVQAELPAAELPAERAAVVESAAPTVPDPMLAHLLGRCVDEQGAPIAGCTAKIHTWGRNASSMAMQGKVDWKDPEPCVSGADGRFAFHFAPPSGLQFALDVNAEGRTPRTGRWGQITPAQHIDLGDIKLQSGFPVRGRVVDELGVPVAKVGVGLQNLPLPIAPDMAANDTRMGFSDANGDFAIEVPIPIGVWPVDVQANGMRHLTPDRATVTAQGAEPLLVTVRRMPSITGIVVDESGAPVKGVGVQANLNRSGRMAGGRSRADGTFTIHAVDLEPKPVQLRIDDPGPCEPPAPDERLWEWGSRDVRIELRRALTCELAVVERATGTPVTEFAVSCYSTRANSSLHTELRLSGEHPEGRVTVDKIWRGGNVLQVLPRDPALRPSAVIEFEATDAGVPPLRVEVDRLRGATVRVATAEGQPWVGSKVEVVIKGSTPFGPEESAQDPRSGARSWFGMSRYRVHELVSQAQTDQDGRAKVLLPASPDGLVVRVSGAHATVIVDPALFVPEQELVVVPPLAGSIQGTLRVQGLDMERIRVGVQRVEGQRVGRFGDALKVGADGAFAIPGLLPGLYRLTFSYQVKYRTESSGSGGSAALNLPNTEVLVEGGRAAVVEIDATALVPGTVRGRAVLDGVPQSDARIFLQGAARFGQFVPDDAGVFIAAGLLPGTYRLGLVVGDFKVGGGDTLLQDDTFELAAGQRLERDFVFVRRRLVITLLQADGQTPAAGVRCSVHGPDLEFRTLTSDRDGKLVLDPAPAGPIQLQPANTRVLLGPVQVPLGQTRHEATLQLPAPK
jgi:hypothetical protein